MHSSTFFAIKEFHERFSVTSNSYQKIDMMQKCERNLYDFGKDEKIRREFFLKTYCIRCPLLQRFWTFLWYFGFCVKSILDSVEVAKMTFPPFFRGFEFCWFGKFQPPNSTKIRNALEWRQILILYICPLLFHVKSE